MAMTALGQEDEIEEITSRLPCRADHCMKWPHSANVQIFWSLFSFILKQPFNICSIPTKPCTYVTWFTVWISSSTDEYLREWQDGTLGDVCWKLRVVMMSLWQPVVPPVMTKLASWPLSFQSHWILCAICHDDLVIRYIEWARESMGVALINFNGIVSPEFFFN